MKRIYGEAAGDEGYTLQEEIRKDMLQVVDRLSEEIDHRFEQMHIINRRFGFTQFSILVDLEQTEFIAQRIDSLVAIYDELDGSELQMEFRRLRRNVKMPMRTNKL